MKIVILSETFSDNMGYIGNMLPRYLARLGAEVHMITLDLPSYYQLKDFKETYHEFIGMGLKAGSVKEHDGYYLHVLAHRRLAGYMCMPGLSKKLREIKPDVVYSLASIGWIALQASLLKPILGFKLFTGSHNAASTFKLAQMNLPFWHPAMLRCFLTRFIPGRFVSIMTEKCYGPTKDCAEIAWRFYGVERHKVEVLFLGVDSDCFFPITSIENAEERKQLRKDLGYGDDDIVCVYSGKMTEEKNAVILAKAIQKLCEAGYSYRGLFIGAGAQKDSIRSYNESTVIDFMPYQNLGRYYRAADIGVWPTNESTSMLDAAACGLPLIVSDGIVYREHVEGNGLVYRMNDVDDLICKLLLLNSKEERRSLGSFGAKKMSEKFSWELIARRRLEDMKLSLSTHLNV